MNSVDIAAIISAIASVASTVGIFLAVVQLQLNRKQLNVAVMVKCINDYRQLGDILLTTTDETLVFRYVDLVSEELFYIQEKYLPKAVCREWVDGMIDYMPIIHKSTEEVLNLSYCFQELVDNRDLYLQGFPRVRSAFIVEGKYIWDVIYEPSEQRINERIAERKRLINEILTNIARFKAYK